MKENSFHIQFSDVSLIQNYCILYLSKIFLSHPKWNIIATSGYILALKVLGYTEISIRRKLVIKMN